MNILFLGCLYSSEYKALFLQKSTRGYQYAAQNLQEALVDGFILNCPNELKVMTVPALSTFPKGCKIPRVVDDNFIYNGKTLGMSFGFLNLPFVNYPCRNKIDRYIDNWCESSIGDKTIFVYALLRHQMEYAIMAKHRHPDIKICVIIPDLPMFMNCNVFYKMLGLHKRDVKSIDNYVRAFDYYVVLAKPMAEALKIADKPFIVMEGIYNDMPNDSEEVVKLPNKTVMYAGGIQTRYGVFDLIEAFHRLKGEDYRLLLCGSCGEMEKLNQHLALDSRISYLGLVPTEKVRELQKQVTLLVNPRHSTEEFTKYSFPSKTLEYMASGTPVLMCPLPSMPEEYKEHVYLFGDESVDGMSNTIHEILSNDMKALSEVGLSAKRFIKEHKNARVQVLKIMEMFNTNCTNIN